MGATGVQFAVIDTYGPKQETTPHSANVETIDRHSATTRNAALAYGLALAGILFLAAALRLAGIGFGLPYLYHWDEKTYFHGAFYALATGGQTESLLSGNMPYLLVPVLWAMSIANGFWPGGNNLSRLVTLYLRDPTPFYLLGRILWVGFQLLAIWLTYLIGRNVLSRRAGLIAAAFVSVAFLAVSEGHYIKGDSTAMLGAALAAWAALRLLERPTPRWYLLLGAAVGLSIACKAYTFTLVVVPLIAHILAWPNWVARWQQARFLALATSACIVAFAVALPAVIVDPLGTWEIFKGESSANWASLPAGDLPVWLTYWTSDLWDGMGWPVELAGLAGFALWLILWLRRRDAKRLLLVTFPIILLVGIAIRSNNFPRYALPQVPFVALAAGDLLDHATRFWILDFRFRISKIRNPKSEIISSLSEARGRNQNAQSPKSKIQSPKWEASALALIVALLCLPPLLNDLRFAAYASSPDTRTLAVRWIETHLPAGSSVVGEGFQGFEATSTLGVPVRPDPAALGITWSPTSLRPPDEFWRVPLLNWLKTYTPTYELTFAPTLTKRGEITSTEQWNNPEAFIMLSWRSDPEKGSPPSPFWDDLKRNYVQAARFDCAPCFPNDPYAWAVDYPALAQVNPLSGETVAGPRIWVYTRKGCCLTGAISAKMYPP